MVGYTNNTWMCGPEKDGLYKYGKPHIFPVYLVPFVKFGDRLLQNTHINYCFYTKLPVNSERT